MSDPLSPESKDMIRLHKDSTSPLIAFNMAIVSLAAVAVALRLWARITTKTKLMKDDFLIVISLVQVLATGVCVIAILQFQEGLGTRTLVFSTAQLSKLYQLRYWAQLIYVPCLATTRLSILAFYNRLFPTRSFRIAVWVLAVLVVTQTIIFFFLFAFVCKPIHAFWRPVQDFKCLDWGIICRGQAGFSVPIDAIILVMPLTIIWRLQMTLRRKLALSATFLIGSGALAAAIFGLYLLHPLRTLPMPDWLLHAAKLQMWVNLEPCIGIVAACLPVAGPLLWKHFKQSKFSGSNSRVVSNSVPTLFRKLDRYGTSHGAAGPDSNDSNDAILRSPEVAYGYNRSGKVTASRELVALDEDEWWQPDGPGSRSGAKPFSAYESQP